MGLGVSSDSHLTNFTGNYQSREFSGRLNVKLQINGSSKQISIEIFDEQNGNLLAYVTVLDPENCKAIVETYKGENGSEEHDVSIHFSQ